MWTVFGFLYDGSLAAGDGLFAWPKWQITKLLEYTYHPWDWYICLHEWLILMVNVGKYTIHGWYGICFGTILHHTSSIFLVFDRSLMIVWKMFRGISEFHGGCIDCIDEKRLTFSTRA